LLVGFWNNFISSFPIDLNLASLGALASQGCKKEFTISSARVLNSVGKEIIIAQRTASNLYYVSRMFTRNFNSTQLLLPTVKISAQCYVHRTDLINKNIRTPAITTNRENNRNTTATSFPTIQQQTDTGSGTTTSRNDNARQQT